VDLCGRVEDAAQLVRVFLDRLQARDLQAAAALLSDDFEMTVSGGHRFASLSDFADFSRSRQRGSRKHYRHFDAIPNDDQVVVYCMGDMEGTWTDGSTFAGVRFIDRFTVRTERIATMAVYSDLAEFRPEPST